MIWLLLDGTVVTLGGEVRGESAFAKALRRDVERVRLGRPPLVFTRAPEAEPLDLDVPYLVDLWLRNEARFFGVALASAPAVERPERPDDETREDVEY